MIHEELTNTKAIKQQRGMNLKVKTWYTIWNSLRSWNHKTLNPWPQVTQAVKTSWWWWWRCRTMVMKMVTTPLPPPWSFENPCTREWSRELWWMAEVETLEAYGMMFSNVNWWRIMLWSPSIYRRTWNSSFDPSPSKLNHWMAEIALSSHQEIHLSFLK